MRTNPLETLLGAVVLLAAGGFIALALRSGVITGTAQGYPLRAAIDDISGLQIGQEVRIAGVPIGKVTGQHLNPQNYQAEIDLLIQPDVQIPDDSSLRLVPESLLGGVFIEISIGGSPDAFAPNDLILDTQGSVNLLDLFSRFIFPSANK